MLKEAVIHLVKNDNNGNSLAELNETYLKTIAKTFGGFTVTDARGGWISDAGKLYDEPVLRVSIACDEEPETYGKLKQIATTYKQDANQVCVYIISINGVEFI